MSKSLGGFDRLTERESQVLEGVLAGKLNKRIGEELSIATSTVEIHRANMKRKVGVTTIAELVILHLKKKMLNIINNPDLPPAEVISKIEEFFNEN